VSKEFLRGFGERLAKARKTAGFGTQEKLAEALGVSQGTVGNWESGANTPTIKQAVELASALAVSVGSLIGETETPTQGAAMERAIREIVRDELRKVPVDSYVASVVEGLLAQVERMPGSDSQGSSACPQPEGAAPLINGKKHQ
jgi:transcriptional regulator with XRE-family HTH domain